MFEVIYIGSGMVKVCFVVFDGFLETYQMHIEVS